MASLLVLEPYDTGSHAAWMRGYQQHSHHSVNILSLPGQWWQWRMHGGAVTLARLFNDTNLWPDLILASDMLDLTTFLALTRARTAHITTAIYFHENQLSYPPGPRIKHDLHYGFINYASALAADYLFFNSPYHQSAFFDELPRLLKHYPDYNELDSIDVLRARSRVLPLGIDLKRFDAYGPKPDLSIPTILWNHRWEYDKNPMAFFAVLDQLIAEGVDFRVILAGENIRQTAEEFEQARERLGNRLIHFGFVADFASYAQLLWQSSIAVSCAWQDFFGVSMAEAIYCGCLPIMPRRLNYPDLIPPEYHELCLYEEGQLAQALKRHLYTSAPPALRHYIAKFDWETMAKLYDDTFEAVIGAKTGE